MTNDPFDMKVTRSGTTDVQPPRSPTRRTLLSLLAAVPIVPTEAPSSAKIPGNEADPLHRLFHQFEAITAAHERALARVDRLEARLVSAIGHPRVRLPSSPGHPDRYASDLWSIERAKLPHRYARRLKRQLRRRQQAWNSAALELGLTDSVRYEEVVGQAMRTIGDLLLATPATSPRAITLKLLVLLALQQPGSTFADTSPWRELRLILGDVAHLANDYASSA